MNKPRIEDVEYARSGKRVSFSFEFLTGYLLMDVSKIPAVIEITRPSFLRGIYRKLKVDRAVGLVLCEKLEPRETQGGSL